MAISNIPPKELIHRFFLLGSFRLGLYALQGLIYALKSLACVTAKTLAAIDRDFNAFCRVVDFEMFGHSERSVVAHQSALFKEPAIFDPYTALKHKHVLVGETGAGKSTVTTWLAYSVGGRVTVYEPEGSPGDWNGLESISSIA